jgi:polysaccharide pyruvyl transferase WcaK-like protein
VWLDTLLLRQPSLWLNWAHALRTLKNCDLFVISGAGVIHDYRDQPWGWPSRFLRWSLAAKLCSAPMLLLCVGAGPVHNSISRVMMKWVAQLATQRCYRDEGSHAFMQSIGVRDAASSVMADLAFLLPTPAVPARSSDKLVVGLGVMSYRGWRKNDPPSIYSNYLDAMARFVTHLRAKGHGIRILIGQNPSDLPAVEELERRVGAELMSAEEKRMSSFEALMRAVAETDVVVASRYHVQIAAVKLRRPVVSVTYGPMNDALMQSVGLFDFRQHIEQIDDAKLASAFDALVEQRARFAGVVDQKVTAIETALPAQLRTLVEPYTSADA